MVGVDGSAPTFIEYQSIFLLLEDTPKGTGRSLPITD